MSKPKPGKANKATETNEKKDSSAYVHPRSKLNYQVEIVPRHDLTTKQQQLINIILDKKTRMVFVSGPAGTSKTYVALLAALQLLNSGRVSDITYLRTAVEAASRSLGFTPGSAEDKASLYMRPLEDKLEEFLVRPDIDRLKKEKRVMGEPINYLRGSSFNAKCIIFDEATNATRAELTMVMTRLGEFSKFLFCGDPNQSDIKNSGFLEMFDLFNDESSREQGIHCFSFTKDDIVRSKVLRYIVERIENLPRQ